MLSGASRHTLRAIQAQLAILLASAMILALGALPVPALLTKLEARGLIPRKKNSGAAS